MLGWHAPQMRRAIIVIAIGVVIAAALRPFVVWGRSPYCPTLSRPLQFWPH
jgi:hypothetical protein